jgi:hypothetical protein
LRFSVTDWIDRPLAVTTSSQAVFHYYFDVGRSFFSDAHQSADTDSTRSKVRRVKLWCLTPPAAIDKTTLFQVMCAVPVKDEGPTPHSLSLLGQSNTIIHPDVRQPWVMVGNWNWETIFENSQYQPFEVDDPNSEEDRDLLALFSLLVIDATAGTEFGEQATGRLYFKLEVELQAPIPLVPAPLRMQGTSQYFTAVPEASMMTLDGSPVQYSLKSIHLQM